MLLMKDMEIVTAHCDTGSAIEIENATLAWEKPVAEKEKSDKPSMYEYCNQVACRGRQKVQLERWLV